MQTIVALRVRKNQMTHNVYHHYYYSDEITKVTGFVRSWLDEKFPDITGDQRDRVFQNFFASIEIYFFFNPEFPVCNLMQDNVLKKTTALINHGIYRVLPLEEVK